MAKLTNSDGTLFYDEKRKKWRLQISYYSSMGELKRKSFSGDTKAEVKKKKKQFERKIILNQITDTSNCTIVDLLNEAAQYDLAMGEIEEAAYIRRVFVINIIEQSNIGQLSITKIDEKIINDFLFSLKSQYSNSVIGKVYSAIKKAFKIAISKKIANYNPVDSPFVKKPKSNRKDTKVTAFTCEEQQQFLDALKRKVYPKDRINFKPILYIAIFTGMRMGEILALNPENIDLERNIIHVENTITRGLDYKPKVGSKTKTKTGERSVPINSQLHDILAEALADYIPNKDNLLFYNYKNNSPITTQSANDSFKRLCEKNNIQISGGQHILRHTFITRCIEADIPIEVIMQWAGHKDISTTINTYTDVFKRRNDKSMDKLSQYFDENLKI